MCLPNLIEYKQIDESNPIIGYRTWRVPFDKDIIKSEYINYTWKELEGPHGIGVENSGIYAYNYYYNYNYNDYNYYNNNYDHNNYYDYYYYNGIIQQWGKVAIHKIGQRSEYAKVQTLFAIRKSDAQGPIKFLNWIDEFNEKLERIAKIYKCDVINYQDFTESQQAK